MKVQSSFEKVLINRDLTRELHDLMIAVISILKEIAVNHKLGTTYDSDTSHGKWLVAKSEALILKLNLIRNQLWVDTYPAPSLKALKTIKASVDKNREQLRSELLKYEAALKAYRSVGMGFERMGKEYATLLEEIENKKWAISELGKKHCKR